MCCFLPKGNGKTAAISIASLLEDYCDHFIAYWKVCKHLGLKVGTSENGGSNMLKRMNIDNPTQQQKEEAENKAIEEHHTILFILGANKYKYGKLIEDMKNDILRKKDPCPKTSTEACHVLSSGKSTTADIQKTESNDGIAFATVIEEKETKNPTKITCFRCKKTGTTPMNARENRPRQTMNKKH